METDTTALKLRLDARERLAFLLIRGVIALALAALAAFCVVTGVRVFGIPHTQAEQIGIDVLGLPVSAAGLASVIFGAGIVIAYFAGRTPPRRTTSTVGISDGSGPQTHTNEIVECDPAVHKVVHADKR